MKVTKKFNIDENKRIEKIGKNLRRAWKKKKKVLLELSLRELISNYLTIENFIPVNAQKFIPDSQL